MSKEDAAPSPACSGSEDRDTWWVWKGLRGCPRTHVTVCLSRLVPKEWAPGLNQSRITGSFGLPPVFYFKGKKKKKTIHRQKTRIDFLLCIQCFNKSKYACRWPPGAICEFSPLKTWNALMGRCSPLVWLSWRQTVVHADRWGFALGPDRQPPGSSEQPAPSGVAQHLFPNNKSSASRLEWIIATYKCVKLDFYDSRTSPQTSAEFHVLMKNHIFDFCCTNKLHVNIQWQDTDVASLVFEPWRSQHSILSLQDHSDVEQLCFWSWSVVCGAKSLLKCSYEIYENDKENV